MALNLYMVGVMSKDPDKTVEFYRRLGVGFPEGTEGQPHVEAKMKGDLTFFVNSKERPEELANAGVIFEFYLKERSLVDAKYAELIGYGYKSFHEPFLTAFGPYFALVNDPDGNTVLLTAD